jgi:hypothetical protein
MACASPTIYEFYMVLAKGDACSKWPLMCWRAAFKLAGAMLFAKWPFKRSGFLNMLYATLGLLTESIKNIKGFQCFLHLKTQLLDQAFSKGIKFTCN